VVDTLWTFGHGTLAEGELVDLLRAAGIEAVADIRRYPGSRRWPHLAREQIARWLPEAGVAYEWIEQLGGRRRVRRDSPNVGLRNEQFRAYADHMTTAEFRSGLERLDAFAGGSRTAVMCSESVWWRCHRRLVGDHLVLIEGVEVLDLFHDGRVVPHPVTPGAVGAGDHVEYHAEVAGADGDGSGSDPAQRPLSR
jgi:uncharacterized protein (DUF488 family)